MRSKAAHSPTESTAMNGITYLVLPTSSEPLDNWSNETANYNSYIRVDITSV